MGTDKMSTYRDLIPIEKCARCGYDELKCSLHVHHIDEDRTNNDTSNLVVLCANCHMGLHNNLWSLADIGITVTERKITPAYISDMKYEIETLKSKISKSNQLNTELKDVKTHTNIPEQLRLILEKKKEAALGCDVE
jgi:hypothetical protein